VSEPIVEAGRANWGPRCAQAGVDLSDFLRTSATVDRWDEWLGAWDRLGDDHAARAREAEQAGRRVTAGEAWLYAALAYHFAKFVWVEDDARSRPVHDKSVAANYSAHRLLETGLERIEVPLDKAKVVGNLRKPRGAARSPLVLLIPGLDSTKEEFFETENAFLRRGMATFSLDGPGQGESAYDLPIRPDYETAVAPVLDTLLGRDDLDPGRVGIFGVSMGGYYAPRAAAFEPRIKAVVGLSGPYRVVETWPAASPNTRRNFTVRLHAKDEAEAGEKMAAIDLTGILEGVQQPALFVTGDRDVVVPWEQTERQAQHAPNGTFVNVPGGSHGVSNFPYLWRSMVTDWMSDQLG
jgi:pimeloyl-ACP methyl ester carboxylesterase